MFIVGLGAGLMAHSSALIADSLDMLADAAAYAVALLAQRRDAAFKLAAARASGYVLLVLGGAVLVDVARRAVFGAEAEGIVISVIACLSLVTNLYVFRRLSTIKGEGIHLRAAWIFTRADVVANLCVIVSGLVVWGTGFGTIDLIVGTGIALYVLKEALEIFTQARRAGYNADTI
jgi:Co/Zn/Cd efflux system component